MFSYKTPNLIKRVSGKGLRLFLAVLYLLSIIPMLVIARYDWPAVDDFSMALQPHQTFAATGSFFATMGSVFEKTAIIYNTWVGYFFSSFLTCLSPSIFGEKYYFLVVYVILAMLTVGVVYFFDALFVKVWGMDKDLTRAASYLTLLILVQSMENGTARAEAFYWWSGAINYTFMFGLFLLWLGMVFRYVFEKAGVGRLIGICVIGFLLGGSNYMTALVAAVCSVLGIVLYVLIRTGKFKLQGNAESQDKKAPAKAAAPGLPKLLFLPFVLNILGLAVSAAAPGNRIRGTSVGNISPVKAVLRAYYTVFDVSVNGMMRWEVLIAFAVLMLIFWKMAAGMKHRLEHPFIFGAFSISMMAVVVVPPLYAVNNIDGPRIRSTIWLQFVVMMVVTIFYYVVWARQQRGIAAGAFAAGAGAGEADTARVADSSFAGADAGKATVSRGADSSFAGAAGGGFQGVSAVMIVLAALVIAFGSLLCVFVNPAYYSGTSAIYDLASGNAAAYGAENRERLAILNDESVKDAVLPAHQHKPEVLFQSDIYEDSSIWENTVVATYYNKDSVAVQ